MPLYPDAKPLFVNRANERFRGPPLGLLLHISNNRGNTLEGLQSHFNQVPIPSHFGIDVNGNVGQFINTDYHDWSVEWTVSYFSVECCASPGDEYTDKQIDSLADLYAWLHETHGIEVRIATSVNDKGLSHHSMGAKAGKGHPWCPGQRVLDQRERIIRKTQTVLGLPVEPVTGNPAGMSRSYY